MSLDVVYQNTHISVQYRTQEDDRTGAPALSPYDRDVLQTRGITPELIKARRYRSWTAADATANGFTRQHVCDTLAVPNYNLAGEMDDYLLRPHTPPIDKETGKPRKYLWRPGHTPALGGPPAGTPEWEARAHQLREDLNTPVIVTESVIKGDSVLAHAQTDVYTLAIHGTWNWVDNGAPTRELREIPWRKKQHDRVTQRRVVVLVPDSDYATKPEVAFAWFTFGEALRRRKADVRLFILQPAPDGSKMGPDDALATGVVTVTQILEEAAPLPADLPEVARIEGNTTGSDTEARRRIATLEADLTRARALISAQAQLIQNPALKDKERALGFRVITMAASKASRGEVDDKGIVCLSAAEVANDWRPKPAKGEAIAPTNPKDESYPIARRDTVKATLGALTTAGVLSTGLMPTKRVLESGDWYADTDISIRADDVADVTAAIINLASYRRAKQRKPYTRQEPCPHCHEMHTRTQTTTCDGCGAVIKEKTLNLPVADMPLEDLTDEQREDLEYGVSASGKYQEAETNGDGWGTGASTNCPENIRRQADSDASGKYQEADRTPLVPRCSWHLGEGEECGEPTEAWEHQGYGNTILCARHAERMRNSGSQTPHVITVSRAFHGEVAS